MAYVRQVTDEELDAVIAPFGYNRYGWPHSLDSWLKEEHGQNDATFVQMALTDATHVAFWSKR